MIARFSLLTFTLLLLALPVTKATAQDAGFPVCEMSDSLAMVADDLDALLHRFGSDTVAYPHEFSDSLYYPVFHSVFEFWLSDGVSDRWSQSDFQTLIASVLDNDSTVTDDVFGTDWNYFVRSGVDANPYHAGVRLTFPYPTGTVTKIILRLYDKADLPSPCSPGPDCKDGPYGYACCGYSWYRNGSNLLTINASPANSMDVVLKLGIGHELQHLCYYANGYPLQYESTNETMSTLAEHLLDGWRPHYYDIPYDASIMRYETCDANSKYEIEKMWIVYLYEVFKGNPSDPTDDLTYRWIHTNTSVSTRMRLSGLATTLWDDDYDWVGGVDATDRLNRVFANFLAAKFCNAPDFGANGEYGMGSISTVKDFALFLDNCDWYAPEATPLAPVDCPENPLPESGHAGCWNVRILPPEYTLSSGVENTPELVTGIYEDGDAPGTTGDGSSDYIDVAYFGSDYVVFRAGAYYQDGDEHELQINVEGNTEFAYGENWRMTPVGWVIGYSADDDTLQVHPEHIVFIEPVTFSPSTTLGSVTTARPIVVTDFGRSIKAVVLAISGVTPYPDNVTLGGINRFFYEYEYAVFTPGASTRAWDGDVYMLGDVTVPANGVLDIADGTRIKVWPSDLAAEGIDTTRVEFNVEGELIAEGTSSQPIVFESWDPQSTEDWVGFYFDSQSGGGTFDHCHISRAEYAIESYVPLTVTNTVVDNCRYAHVVSQAGGATIDGCQLTNSGSFGIYLGTGSYSTVVRNTLVEGAVGTALHLQPSESVTVRNSTFASAATGLLVNGATANVDSTCYFYNNGTGMHFYMAGSSSVVRDCYIGENSSNAILCDSLSSPLIDTNVIGFNGGGIYCSKGSSPKIQGNQVQASGNAVTAASGADPDVGHASPSGGQSPGNNSIAHTGKYVVNYNSTGTIYAQNNCWHKNTSPCAPSASLFTGSVDRSSPICCEFPRWTDTSIIEPQPQGFVYQLPTASPRAAPSEKPTVSGLVAIVPNPFNPTTTIHYSLAAPGNVEIRVYDVAGRLVQDLTDGPRVAGAHSVVWTGTDRRGTPVASGVYFVRMVTPGQVFTKKMVMLK